MRDIPRRGLVSAFVGLAVVTHCGPLLAAEAVLLSEGRLAIKGYDPVSYFTEGRPEPGTAEYKASFDGVIYWFKSAEHRALFTADPDRYAPQFAGYCAVTLSRGSKYEADPEAWAIADGKLYVFGSKQGVPTFKEHTASIIEKATENWAKLRNEP